MITLLRKEFYLHRTLLVILILTLLFSYSVYLLGEPLVNQVGQEDGIFEYLTALFFFLASLTFGLAFFRTRKIFFLLLALILFVRCGEEISWGQRIFGFGTPDYLKENNVQGETTLHNIEILNSHDFDNAQKTGLRKLLTVDFLYKLFCIGFGLVLPLLVYYLSLARSIVDQISLPVPPLLLGAFFLINWLVFKFILAVLLPAGRDPQYYDTVGEISEFVSSVVFFIVALAIYKMEKQKLMVNKRPD